MYVIYVCFVCIFIQRSDGSRPSRVKSGRLLYPQRSGMATLGWLPTLTNIMSAPHPPQLFPQSNNAGEQHINKRPTANDYALICILHIHTVYIHTQIIQTLNIINGKVRAPSYLSQITLYIYIYSSMLHIVAPSPLIFLFVPLNT